MHSDVASICDFVAADGFPVPGPPSGMRLPHAFWAAWNDGDAGLMPELLLRLKLTLPPEVLGSGKFGTPWERMHDAKLTPAIASFEAVSVGLLGLVDEPQPAITSTPDRAVTAAAIRARLRASRCGMDIPGGVRAALAPAGDEVLDQLDCEDHFGLLGTR
jgi:hypothetical protein